MNGRAILKMESPVTQSIDAVKNLLAFVGRASDPLPSDVSLDNGRLVLILSNKKDAYYVATAAKCSCPSATFHHGPCKHQRRYFPAVAAGTKPTTKPTASGPLVQRGGFKPVDLLPSEERAAEAAWMQSRVQQPRHGKLNKTFSLPVATIALLKDEAARTGKAQSVIMKDALDDYIKKDDDLLSAIRRIIREELDR